jgi:hypothetical protein
MEAIAKGPNDTHFQRGIWLAGECFFFCFKVLIFPSEVIGLKIKKET